MFFIKLFGTVVEFVSESFYITLERSWTKQKLRSFTACFLVFSGWQFLFSMTYTLVIARKSKFFVAIPNTCVALDYFVTAFLVMTVNFYIHPFSSPWICGFSDGRHEWNELVRIARKLSEKEPKVQKQNFPSVEKIQESGFSVEWACGSGSVDTVISSFPQNERNS